MRKRFMLLLLFGVGCVAPRPTATGSLAMPQDTALDDTLVVPLGQSAVTSDNTVRIALRSKLQDSRCAANVQCVWAGSVGVGVRVETLQSASDGDVHTNQEPRIFWAGQHQITLLDVTPRPGEPNAPVTATLRVVRLGK